MLFIGIIFLIIFLLLLYSKNYIYKNEKYPFTITKDYGENNTWNGFEIVTIITIFIFMVTFIVKGLI